MIHSFRFSVAARLDEFSIHGANSSTFSRHYELLLQLLERQTLSAVQHTLPQRAQVHELVHYPKKSTLTAEAD